MQSPREYLYGFDPIRILAIGFVTAQHALSLLNRESDTGFLTLSIGQIGVALFLAVSGYLAALSQRPPVSWLMQRLRRVFPAYWIVMIGSFLIAGLTNHKSFDARQVIAQLLGIGFFTHGDNIVNGPTWFVSLLMACYAGTFLFRCLRMQLILGVVTCLTLAVTIFILVKPLLVTHFLTYFLACTLALLPRPIRRVTSWALIVAFIAIAIFWMSPFGYPAIALLGMEVAQMIRYVPRLIQTLAEYTYEYYLVHGIALFGAVRFLPAYPTIAITIGILASSLVAIVLHVTLAMVLKQRK